MKTTNLKPTITKSLFKSSVILAAAFLLPGCQKTGPTPNVPATFGNIQVNGSCVVTLTPGANNKVISSAPSVVSYMWGNTLMVSGSGNVNIEVGMLDTLTSLGSNTITNSMALTLKRTVINCAGATDSINLALNASDSVKVLASGQGKYYLIGNTSKLIVAESGSANFHGYGLTAQNCNTSTLGSGDAEVFVTGNLSALVIGSGNVYYKGNPTKVSPVVLGSGKIMPK